MNGTLTGKLLGRPLCTVASMVETKLTDRSRSLKDCSLYNGRPCTDYDQTKEFPYRSRSKKNCYRSTNDQNNYDRQILTQSNV